MVNIKESIEIAREDILECSDAAFNYYEGKYDGLTLASNFLKTELAKVKENSQANKANFDPGADTAYWQGSIDTVDEILKWL